MTNDSEQRNSTVLNQLFLDLNEACIVVSALDSAEPKVIYTNIAARALIDALGGDLATGFEALPETLRDATTKLTPRSGAENVHLELSPELDLPLRVEIVRGPGISCIAATSDPSIETERLQVVAEVAFSVVSRIDPIGVEFKTTPDEIQEIVSQASFLLSPPSFKFEDVDVETLIQRVSDVYGSLYGGRVQVATQAFGSKLFVRANTTALRSALNSIITTASRSIGDGRGKISVSARKDNDDPTQLLIEIKDDGQGFDAKSSDKILRPLASLLETEKLGLAIAATTLKQLGGSLTIKTAKGLGSTYSIRLPMTKQSMSWVARSPSAASDNNTHILYVDDESAITDVIRELLEIAGYRVSVANTAEDALMMIETDPSGYDLVITDQVMPSMLGSELALKVRQVPSAPVVGICTAYPHDPGIVSLPKGIVRGILEKPASLESYSDFIENILSANTPTP
ncbi:MAG: response regulator [Planctomycetes bacterium]|nr:response regulator [Planctomycetota bacterium]